MKSRSKKSFLFGCAPDFPFRYGHVEVCVGQAIGRTIENSR